jgi:hypothetical protein
LAGLPNRQADDFGYKCLGELAHLGVFHDGRRERARAAADDEPFALSFKIARPV